MSDSTNLVRKIRRLKRARKALILAHNYQPAEVQEIADHTGDSLELSRIALRAKESVIIFCGVRFMAETAAILCPDKTVLLPVPRAGCPLADTAAADQVRRKRKESPGIVIVAYVNTSAEVKAESHICCTSANAVDVVRSIRPGPPILFVPDRNLGRYAARISRRPVVPWEGECPVHASLSENDIRRAKQSFPDAIVMAHPECRPEVLRLTDHVAGTGGMLEYASRQAAGTTFIVGTEVGLLHRLRKENRDKVFHAAADCLVCPDMKLMRLSDVARCLQLMAPAVKVNGIVRIRAKAALDAMLGIPMFRKEVAGIKA